MNRNEIWHLIQAELKRAKAKHPNWPDHMSARGAIVAEEAGELLQACNNFKYHRKNKPDADHLAALKMEAVQTAVTAIRFLENLEEPQTNTSDVPTNSERIL